MADQPIRIVGGGIAGLTTALCLAKHGISSTIHEQAPAFEEVGAGLQLSPNALKVLFALGLRDALAPHATTPDKINITSGINNEPIASVALGSFAEERYGAPYWVMHRADLQHALVQACETNALVELKTSAQVSPDDAPGLTIAADGVNSQWRAKVQRDPSPRFTGTIAWRALEPATADHPMDRTQLWLGPNAHLVCYPLREGTERNLVAIARTTTPDAMLKAFDAWSHAVRARIMACEGWIPWPLNAIDPSGSWAKGNTVLIGDAAHAMLPFVAQGAAMAIEDAWVLAACLLDTDDQASALARFEATRKPRVTKVWREAVRNGQIYHMTGPMAFGRNVVLRASKPEQLLARYDWLYGWEPPGLPQD